MARLSNSQLNSTIVGWVQINCDAAISSLAPYPACPRSQTNRLVDRATSERVVAHLERLHNELNLQYRAIRQASSNGQLSR